MENELNYLSEKIEEIEHSINISKFAEGIEKFEYEKELLENILNKLTEIELSNG